MHGLGVSSVIDEKPVLHELGVWLWHGLPEAEREVTKFGSIAKRETRHQRFTGAPKFRTYMMEKMLKATALPRQERETTQPVEK